MQRKQIIKMIIGLAILGIVLFFVLFFYFNKTDATAAKITLNMVPYQNNGVNITIPQVSGDEKIAKIIEDENLIWKLKAQNNEIKTLNVTTTYYDENYLSILYSATDSNKNKELSSVVINLNSRKKMKKNEIVNFAIKNKFEKEGKADPKLKYSEKTFSQFDFIYLEKGTDNSVNAVFCWRDSKTGQVSINKLNGYEIVKSMA